MVALPLKTTTTLSPAVNREAGSPLSPIVRSFEILFLVARHGTEFLLRLAYLCLRRRRNQSSQLLGESLARLCEALGPTAIKVGQILSSRPDLLPAGVGAPLLRLQEQIAPFDGAQIPETIEAAFGRPFAELFDSFDLTPVASASLSSTVGSEAWNSRDLKSRPH